MLLWNFDFEHPIRKVQEIQMGNWNKMGHISFLSVLMLNVR
jgi:hypothetical protein